MTLSGEPGDKEFMLKRCLGLCLTDRKESLNSGVSVDFDIRSIHQADSIALYPPLSAMIHNFRHIMTFKRDVLGFVERLACSHSFAVKSTLDSDEDHFDDGEDALWGLKATSELRSLGVDDVDICVVIAEEFLHHSEEMTAYFAAKVKKFKHNSLSQLLRLFESEIKGCRNQWRAMLQHHRFEYEAKTRFVHAESKVVEMLADDVSAAFPSKIDEFVNNAFRRIRFTSGLISWRNRWKGTGSGFGSGGRFNFKQNREGPALFELWCFMEVANTFNALGLTPFIQRSMLNASEQHPMFNGARGQEVYYDYHGTAHAHESAKGVLKGIHVEWFFRNPNDPSKSAILDTKYKARSSSDDMKTITYMVEFQATRGVVIYRYEIDPSIYSDSGNDRRFAIHQVPGGILQLCAMTLIPSEREMSANRRTLNRLVNEVLIA